MSHRRRKGILRMEKTTSCGEASAPVNPTAGKNDGKPTRRIGTFTFGWVMIAAGILMILALFFPKTDFRNALRLSPMILISLGVEVLVASREYARFKYDWVAMLLCFLIVCAALVMFAVVWLMLYHPDWIHL